MAYRRKEKYGTPRKVYKESFFEADRETYPKTWDTVDLTNKVVVCIPHSFDPVLFGIRGENPEIVTKAAGIIRSEPVERFAVYRTNQGTDMHLLPAANIAEIRDMHSYKLEGTVSAAPNTIYGGHVFSLLGMVVEKRSTVQPSSLPKTSGQLLGGSCQEIESYFREVSAQGR